jgi:hypothetical protein
MLENRLAMANVFPQLNKNIPRGKLVRTLQKNGWKT